MSTVDFGAIGNIISKVMDSDFIDIKRDSGSQLLEVYSNIPCHISYSSVDNPDASSVDVKPIIQSLTIHLQNWVDVRNNDFLVCKKMSNDGKILITYSGRCGNPVVSQGRKKVNVVMNATESEDPTPVPPKNPSKILIDYLSNNEEIQTSIVKEVELGSSFTMNAPLIEGYKAIDCIIDGIPQGATLAYIPETTSEHNVEFIYEKSEEILGFRFLVNGLYTKDDGSLSNGYHLYKQVGITDISKEGDVYTITSEDVNWIHEDSGIKLNISPDTKLVLMPNEIFVKVTEILDRTSGMVTFTAKEYVPTEAEKESYITDWYN